MNPDAPQQFAERHHEQLKFRLNRLVTTQSGSGVCG